jgi:hypothetical protein
LRETFSATETAAGGVGVSYVIADPLVASAPLPAKAGIPVASGPHSAVMWQFDSADVGAGKEKLLQPARNPVRVTQLLRVQHR